PAPDLPPFPTRRSSDLLALAPWILHWPDPGLAFDVALHFGTLVAVLWYFRAEWIALTIAAKDIVVRRRVETERQRRVLFLSLATDRKSTRQNSSHLGIS